MKWYKHEPDAFLVGVRQLSLEAIGAYIILMNVAYSRDGDLPNDDRLICRHLQCRPQTWRRLALELEKAGKLHRNHKRIFLKRVANVVETYRKLTIKQSVSQKKPNENKGNRPTESRTKNKERETPLTPLFSNGGGDGKFQSDRERRAAAGREALRKLDASIERDRQSADEILSAKRNSR